MSTAGACLPLPWPTGYRNATVKAVCEAAGLTERYFYESFSNSEELLVASFQGGIASGYSQPIHEAVEAAMRLCLVLRGSVKIS